jgi:hypothetical protein
MKIIMSREDTFSFVIAPSVTAAVQSCRLSLNPHDSLEWAAPVVIAAKILLQELWLLKDDWNAPTSQNLEC